MALLTQDGYYNLKLDGAPCDLRHQHGLYDTKRKEIVAHGVSTHVVFSPRELKTVDDCRAELVEQHLPDQADYYLLKQRAHVGGVYLYLILLFTKEESERFSYCRLKYEPPALSREEIARRARFFRQIGRSEKVENCENGFIIRKTDWLICKLPDDYYRTAYTWDIQPRAQRVISPEEVKSLEKVGEYLTLHSFGYVLFFKPSVSECIRYLPESLFIDPNQRYLIHTEMFSGDPNMAIGDEYHIAITTVYRDPGDPPVVIDLTAEPAVKRQKTEETKVEPPDTCCICMTEPADTLVLPCMHQVVCRDCSNNLKNTRDAHICVRCRRPIESVMQDTSGAAH